MLQLKHLVKRPARARACEYVHVGLCLSVFSLRVEAFLPSAGERNEARDSCPAVIQLHTHTPVLNLLVASPR